MSVREFDFTVDLNRVPAADAFGLLDRDADGTLAVSDATGLERPESNDPTAILRWEERTMQVEEGLRTADRDADGRLTLDEFGTEQAVVTAALTGQAPPRASIVPGRIASGQPGTAWNWRFIGLIGFNILLLVGLAWFVLRSKVS